VKKEGNHAFSIELKSKEFLKNVMISNRTGETVLIEGFLGELEELSLVEGAMLELRGSNGILRIDLKEEELERLCQPLSAWKHRVQGDTQKENII
jgi:hypothetical protein